MTSCFRHHYQVRNVALTMLFSMPIALGLATTVLAQDKPAIPNDAPPRLERLEEGEQPGITIRKPDAGTGTTDTRDPSGAVTQTQVNTGVSTYYVRPNRSAGSAQPGDLQSSGNRAAQFKVKEFDLGRKPEPKPAETPQTLEPAPPPPARPANN